MGPYSSYSFFFFFNDTATTEIYTLSLHDALPISAVGQSKPQREGSQGWTKRLDVGGIARSEEHTSELQSLAYLVCRLLLEKKKNTTRYINAFREKTTPTADYALHATAQPRTPQTT